MASPTTILIERLARVVQNDAHAGGLKPTQWEAMRYLSRANRFSQSPSALTEYLGMTKGTVSQTLIALQRKGLIKKTQSADDKRVVRLSVTAAGRKLLKQDPFGDVERALSDMTAKERGAISEMLEDFLRRMLVARGSKSFGACKTCRYFQRAAKNGGPHLCQLLSEPLSEEDSEKICVEQERRSLT